jgi:hypothetical protein
LKLALLILFIGIFSIGFTTVYAVNSGLLEAKKAKQINSPLFQYSQGISLEKISCNVGLHLVLKTSNNQPICLKPPSVKILVERGWAEILEDKTVRETPILPEYERIVKKLEETKPVFLAQESFVMETELPNFSNKYPTVALRLSEIAGQDVIIFEGSGFRESHIIDIRIIDDEGNRIKLKTKTTQRGDMLMPWPIPENLEPGTYNVQFWDRVSEHYLTINLE